MAFPETAALTEAHRRKGWVADGSSRKRNSKWPQPYTRKLQDETEDRGRLLQRAQCRLTSFAEPHPHLPGGGLASPSCVAADWLRLWSPVGFLTQGREEQARTRQVASAGPRMYACAVSSFWSPRRLRAPPSGLKGRALGGEWVSNLRILPSPSPFLWIGYTKLRNHFI